MMATAKQTSSCTATLFPAHSPALLMDWTHWTPQVHAVLCFIIRDGQVLLIHKQRGLGAGKVNGPGGKLEAGESPAAAALRETEEEVGVTPLGLAEAGTVRFQFTDGLCLLCTVFTARDFTGTLTATVEAIPFWSPLTAVPYGEMWEDDRYWLPQVLAGQHINAGFVFEGERMLSQWVEVTTPTAPS